MKTIHVVLLTLFWVFDALSQTAEVIEINCLGQDEGLLQLNTEALALDDMGYVWVGTEDGLHRFNGYEFENFISNPKDSTAIPDDHIRGLLAVNDTLWIATNSNGIVGYERSKSKFFTLPNPKRDKIIDLQIAYNVFHVNETYLLFSVKNHFILFNRQNKMLKVFDLPELSVENRVEDVLQVADDTFWFATSESGILAFDLETKTFQNIACYPSASASCFIDSEDQIYIGSETGVYRYNKSTDNFMESSVSMPVVAMYKLNDFEFYVSTPKGMLKYNSVTNLYKAITFNNYRQNKSYSAVTIPKILGDGNGNLWFGTAGEGLFHYNTFQNKFKSYSIKLPNLYKDQRISIFPMYKSNDSVLWLGTYAGTIKYMLNNATFKLYDTGKGGITYEFCKGKNNELWAGGITEGLMKYNDSLDIFEQWLHTDDTMSLPDNEVLEIIPISEEKLWVCTWAGGISEFDIKTETFTPILLDGKQINRARTSLIDSQHNIWLGTDQGLYRISSANTIQHFKVNDQSDKSLTNNRVFSLQEDNNGNIWIGTSSGLTCYNTATQKTELFYKQKGFPNDFVYGLLIDKNNCVWMSTNYGLSVFNPKLRTFKNYTEEDGLQDNEFNGKSYFKDASGNLYFGGINGFNIITPEKVIDNPHLPNVYIESVELFNKPIERNEMFKDTLTFKSEDNVLTFNFSAINHLNPLKCSYQYKLENFDEDWSPITKKNSVTYTNLNPGAYNLKIKASNDVGEWSPNIKNMHLIIVPPWYKTQWFKVLFGFMLLLSGFVLYKYKTSKLRQDKLKLENLVALRTRDLIAKNEELNHSNEVSKAQKENIEFLMKELNHRVKNNLQIISSLLNMQANNIEEQKLKDILNIAKNRILTMSYIQNDLASQEGKIDVSDFLKEFTLKIIGLMSDKASVKFQVQFNLDKACTCNLNTTLLGLILNELITNTFKYAFDEKHDTNVLKIACTKEGNALVITIADNGKGYDISSVKDNTLGLSLVDAMVSQMHAELKTTIGKGVENKIIITC